MPYIATVRSDIPAGTLQFLDLQPNDSQRNYIYDPAAQAKYARRPDNDSVLLIGAGPITTTKQFSGLAAWLVDHIENTGSAGEALLAAEANAVATALIARMGSGLALAVADVNTVIQLTVAGSGIGLGNSTGTLAELLEVLAGGVYVLPAASQVEDVGNLFDTTTSGSLTASRHTYTTGSFNISRNVGKLSELADATYTYGGTAGAAIVLYADDGSLL